MNVIIVGALIISEIASMLKKTLKLANARRTTKEKLFFLMDFMSPELSQESGSATEFMNGIKGTQLLKQRPH